MKKRTSPIQLPALVSLACLGLLLPAARAQAPTATVPMANPDDPATGLQFRVGAGIQHDSNVRRTPTARSDQIGVLSAGVRYDKQYSLQRITLDAEVSSYKFKDEGSLDYTTLNYNGAWNFAFTPRLRGILSAQREQFRDLTDTAEGTSRSDLRTISTEVAEAVYDLGGGWRTLAGITHSRTKSEAPRTFEASPDVTSARIGGGYEFGSGSSVYLRVRRGEGSYDNIVVGRDFRETEPDVVVRWSATPKTTVSGRVGHIDRKHEGSSERDFSGIVGNARVDWEITGKTALAAGYDRQLGAYEFTGGGNVRTQRLFVEPVWRATAKITVRGRIGHEEVDWRVRSAISPDAGRQDRTRSYGASVDWEPVRNLMVTASVRQEKRNSNIAAFRYDATVVALAARLTF